MIIGGVVVKIKPGTCARRDYRFTGHSYRYPLLQPGWIMRPRDEIGRLTNEAADQDTWIFEGNHSETMIYRDRELTPSFSIYRPCVACGVHLQRTHNPLRTLTPGYGGRLWSV